MAVLNGPFMGGGGCGFESLRDGLQTTRGIAQWLLLEHAVTFGGEVSSPGVLFITRA